MAVKRIGFLVLIASIGGASIAAAQTLGQTSNRDELTSVLVSQSPIRLRLGTGKTVVLHESSIDDGWVLGREFESDSSARFRIDDVSEVWHRTSAAGQGLAIGAALGTVIGAAMGSAVASWCLDLFGQGCPSPSTSKQLSATLAGGLFGGFVMGGIGSLIGRSSGRWTTAYKMGGADVRPIVASSRIGLSIRF